ncbi:hypothetical protein GCK32_014494 [Trichostrongylus colubriformis]|uniref:Uncharacterized protein n=1 Tax=Trichostrongylus colubriformis TaxID=6319 RepID=A0AAN8IDH6_TRICO
MDGLTGASALLLQGDHSVVPDASHVQHTARKAETNSSHCDVHCPVFQKNRRSSSFSWDSKTYCIIHRKNWWEPGPQ